MADVIMDRKVKFRLPGLPNFIIDDKGTSYSLSSFTKDELSAIGTAWTQALIDKSFDPDDKIKCEISER